LSAIRLRQDHVVARDPATVAEESQTFRPVMFDGQDLWDLTPNACANFAQVARGRIPGSDDSPQSGVTIGTQLIETLQEHLEAGTAMLQKGAA